VGAGDLRKIKNIVVILSIEGRGAALAEQKGDAFVETHSSITKGLRVIFLQSGATAVLKYYDPGQTQGSLDGTRGVLAVSCARPRAF